MIADFMTIDYSLFPAGQSLLDTIGNNIKGGLGAMGVEYRQATVNLAQSSIVEGQTDCGSYAFGPAKTVSPLGHDGRARLHNFLCILQTRRMATTRQTSRRTKQQYPCDDLCILHLCPFPTFAKLNTCIYTDRAHHADVAGSETKYTGSQVYYNKKQQLR